MAPAVAVTADGPTDVAVAGGGTATLAVNRSEIFGMNTMAAVIHTASTAARPSATRSPRPSTGRARSVPSANSGAPVPRAVTPKVKRFSGPMMLGRDTWARPRTVTVRWAGTMTASRLRVT